MLTVRSLLVPALSAALLVPGSAAVATPTSPVEVTAVIQTPDGRLSFVTERAASRARGLELAASLRARPRVLAAAVATRVHALGDDPRRGEQWGLTRLAAEKTWQQGPASGALVAVVDSGVDAAHPDLSSVVDPGLDLVGAGDGRTDPHGHGTHVAGVVAAVAGNGVGGAGLAQGARVLPVRALDADGAGYDSDVAEGVAWAVDRGATVVNLSLGGPSPSPVLDAAIGYAISKGVVVVAAAGNAGLDGDPVLYPAATPGVIAVGAAASDDSRPGWSSSGSHLAVAAPGVDVLSTVPGGGYATWNGTSMAAPFVAAAAALVRADEPALPPRQVRDRLMATARDIGAPGFDRHTGAGMVDVVAARAGSRPAPVLSPEPAPVAPTTPDALDPVPTEPVLTEPVLTEPVLTEPVLTEPVAPEPVEPAPVAPAPVEPAPVQTAPAPASAPPATTSGAEPSASQPAPPVTAIRASRSASVVLPGRAVVLSARALSGTAAASGRPLVLERRVGTGPWGAVRTGTTGSDGLVAWTLHPDRSGSHRVRAGTAVSPEVRVDVRQVVTLTTRRSGGTVVVDARVAPGGRTGVALQVLRSSGWVAVARSTTTTTGTTRFVKALGRGTRLRVVATARPALLAGTSAVRAV